jgi:hypothetical protein
MKILALEKETPGISDDQFGPHLKAEARQVWELQQAGILREIYFTADTQCAVLILECADAMEASAVLKTLPLVQHGLIEFEVHPMIPYPGFSRLFEAPGGPIPL